MGRSALARVAYDGLMVGFEELPRVSAYLESLPDGFDSYPECRIIGGMVRALVRERPELDLDRLPDQLRWMMDNPPGPTQFIPEVRLVAFTLAMTELAFESDAAMLDWAEERMWDLLGGTLGWIDLADPSPEKLAEMSDQAWKTVRRGTEREIVEFGDGYNVGRVTYPKNLIPEFYAEILARGILAGYRHSKAAAPRVELLEWSPVESTYRVTYDASAAVEQG